MTDLDKLAEVFASGSSEIVGTYRLVIQPNSVLREFRTVWHGILFTIRGAARMCVNETVYELHPGTVFHAAPDMLLDTRVIGDSEFEYYLLTYRLDNIRDGASVHECDAHFKLEPGANPRVTELLMMLHQSAHAVDGIGKLRSKELFFGIMHQVLMGCRLRESESSPSKMVIEQAKTYINGHYMNPLTLDELAEVHGMSPKSFSYFFHKYTGVRPIDYVIQYRMERASELLLTGNYSIRDVAFSVGYDNPLYFSRVFKKKLGVSPSAYTSQ
ncbi:helix-turn-helix transcriptional regulator [Brevibacillus brevis]|uniref:AraC family transcriptional regulator n=1 Tax=Brevibacillus brevis TaxID=1393 RepID=A0A517IGY9_BREBE|nr:AraC family transcriptional regulator [Brevibacillus brevis]QDS38148.1 AraC family transcriptional regulator [Brevibacillus brevis]